MSKKNPYLSDSDYKKIFGNTVRLCVDLIFDTQEDILLGSRSAEPYKGLYALPGGRVFFGEDIDSSIERIAKKEIGVKVGARVLFSVLEFLDEIKIVGTHSISLVYICQALNKPKKTDDFSGFSTDKYLNNTQIVSQHLDVINRYKRYKLEYPKHITFSQPSLSIAYLSNIYSH